MLFAFSCNPNLSYNNNAFRFRLNLGKFAYPNGILASNPRNFCISQSGTGAISLSSETRKNSEIIPSDKELRHPFAVSYLIDTCGFSPEEALSLAKRLNKGRFDNTSHGPDSVIALLKDYGFDDTHITKAIRQNPTVLVCNPEKRLIPKLEFFRSLGLSGEDLANLMTSWYPNILAHSFERRIIPCYELLKSVLVDDEKVVAAIKGYPRIFRYDVKERLGPNVEALRQAKVSESMISFALLNYFHLFHTLKDQFRAGLDEAIRLGFDSLTFVRTLSIFIRMDKSTESKVEMLKKWGFSNDQIVEIFSKCGAEEKIVGVIDYLVNEMGFKPSDIASGPTVLSHSLQKKIIPRSSVVRVLQLKGLLRKDLKLSAFIMRTEKVFLAEFVIKYLEHVPQLLSIYEGRVGLQELGFGPEDIRGLAES